MRIGIIIATATLLLTSVSGADAHHYRHHQAQNPMVRGLGMGLIVMLRASREHHYSGLQGPADKPAYGPSYETKAKAGELPNVMDVPPKGWPFKRVNQTRYVHHYAGGGRLANLDGSCRSAARQGGPCGCWAQEHFFGSAARLYRGMNLWLARSWLSFPHTQAAAGTAAVWPNGHHVAPVVGVNGDGTVTVRDSWGTHAVRMARLTFVSPR